MSKKSFKILILMAIVTMSCSTEKVDLIVTDAKIYTVNEKLEIAQSFAIKEGKFIKIGTTEEILEKYSSEKTISLEGKFIFPGLIDAHSHFSGYGALLLKKVDLTGTKSFAEVIEKLKEFHKENKFDWIEGRGWDQNDWEIKEFPTKTELDKIFPKVAIYLTRIDGHAAIVNSKALEIANIDKTTKIEGGEILLENDAPTGLLIDNAMSLVRDKIPQMNKTQNIKALKLAQKNCFEVGLTSVCDAGLDKEMVLLMDSLHKTGELKMKIYAMLNPTEENFNHFVKKGIYKTNHLTVSSIKLYADGALGSRGAKLIESYSDKKNYNGLLVAKQEYFNKIAELAYNSNYQLNIHCIGDSAVKMILDTYGRFLKVKNDKFLNLEKSNLSIRLLQFPYWFKRNFLDCN